MSVITTEPAVTERCDACDGCDECTSVCLNCGYCDETTVAQWERGDFDPMMCDCRPGDCRVAPYDSSADW